MAATAASNTNVDIPWRRHPHTTKRRQRIGKIRTMTSTTTKHTYIQLLSNEKIVAQKTEPSQRTSRTGEMVARHFPQYNSIWSSGRCFCSTHLANYLFICFATNRYWSICSTTLFGCCLSVCCWQLVGLRLAWLHQKHQFIRMNKLDMVIFFWFGQSARCRLL